MYTSREMIAIILRVGYLVAFISLFVTCIECGYDGTLLARFRNTADHPIVLWWICVINAECDHGIRFFGHLPPNGGHTSFTTYVGHTFYWAHPKKELQEKIGQFRIRKDKILYVYADDSSSNNPSLVSSTNKELMFLENYYTNHQRHWLSPFGRPPPSLPFVFNKHNFGQNSEEFVYVKSKEYFWHCLDESNPNCRQNRNRNDNNGQEFEIEEISNGFPKVYHIPEFISEFESQHIKQISERLMQKSRVGDGSDSRLDPTRTSTNAWIAMNRTKIIESVYRRIGDVLGIDSYRMTSEAIFNPRRRRINNNNGGGGLFSRNNDRYTYDTGVASHLEVVHFGTHEHYSPHYDNAPGKEINLHFITFQIVLTTSQNFNGGETAFPHSYKKDNNIGNRESEGIAVPSEPLSALFWYNLLEDGNLDESALYSNTEVISGDQWMAHISVWDPDLPEKGDPRMEHDFVYSMHDEL